MQLAGQSIDGGAAGQLQIMCVMNSASVEGETLAC